MRPKEKAKELVDKFAPYANGYLGSSMLTNTEYPQVIDKNAKEMAVITVDEIIEALEITTGHCDLRKLDAQEVQSDFKFWQEVKQEINKL